MNRDSQQLVRLLLQVFRATGGRLPMGWAVLLCIVVVIGFGLLRSNFDLSLPDSNQPPRQTQSESQQNPTSQPASNSPESVLESIGRRRYQSPAGIIYGPGSAHGHRFDHVMAHAADEPDRVGQHGVFKPGDAATVIATIDQAYEQALAGRDTETEHSSPRTIYVVNLRRRIGYIGGQSGNRRGHPSARHVKLVLEDERLITAFPIIP